MLFFKKKLIEKAMKANHIIRDAIVMGICDKFIYEKDVKGSEYKSVLFVRSLNWAVPGPNYTLENDLSSINNESYQDKLKKDEDQIYIDGLKILNTDMLGDLITFYIAYEVHLINVLSPKNGEEKYPGIIRMKKLLFQDTEDSPDIKSSDFIANYKDLFIKFNDEYGKYGKVISTKTIDSLFSLLYI